MTTIPNTTLVCVDCVNAQRAELAIERSLAQCSFSQVLLLTSLDTPAPYAKKIRPITSLPDYSEFMVFELIEHIMTEHLLVVQHDGWVVDGAKWDPAWLWFDYVGGNALFTAPGRRGKGGNGGFSLRSRLLLEVGTRIVPRGKAHPEDTVYSSTLRQHGGLRDEFEREGLTFAPRVAQAGFSCDHVPWSGQFGHHQGFPT